MKRNVWAVLFLMMAMALPVVFGARAARAQGVNAIGPSEPAVLPWDSAERKQTEQKALKAGKRLLVKTWNLCAEDRDLDCQSQGITLAADGNCYFASSTHSGRRGAMVFKYDPKAGKVSRICDDIIDVCSEDPRTQAPQGLMVTNAVELDGWIYWGTHSQVSGFAPRKPYAGGHVVGYQMETGQWRDLGIPAMGCTILAGLAADAKAKRLFVTVSPEVWDEGGATCLYRIDLPKGKFQNVGVVSYGGMVGFPGIWADIQGRCWLGAPGGGLICYDPAVNAMRGWLDALPPARMEQGYPDPLATNQVARMWDWVRAVPGRNQCLFTLKQGAGFYCFSPGLIGRGSSAPFSGLRPLTGYTGQGCAVTEDHVYFAQSIALAYVPGVALLHLRGFDYTSGKPDVIDYGAIADDSGRVPLRIESLAADSDGHVFMVGDWRTLRDDPTTLLSQAGNTYTPVSRAEVFAVGEIPTK